MRTLFTTVVTAVCFSAMGLACGGADDTRPGPEVLVQESQFWEAWRQSACGGYETCCGAKQLPFGRNECVAQTRTVYGPSATTCGDGFSYDPVEGTACLKEIQRTYGECREVRTVDMCSNVCKRSPGTRLVGEACQSFHDCKNPEREEDGWTFCSDGSFDPGEKGTCVFVPRGQVGSTCYASCDGGFCIAARPRPPLTNPAKCMVSDAVFCDVDNDWTCQPARGPGERASSSGMECQAGTHLGEGPGAGVCTPDLPIGSDCRNGGCQAGSYCENPLTSPNGVCTPFNAVGEACKTNEECAFGCVRNVCLREPGSALDITAAMCRGEGGLVFD